MMRPIQSPRSETLNEQLRRAESLPTDTREYMKDIHSVEGERGEGARVTGRGRIYYPLCNYIYYRLCSPSCSVAESFALSVRHG